MKKNLLNFIMKNKIKILSFILILLIAGVSIIISFAYFSESIDLTSFSGLVNYFENPDVNILIMVQDITSDETKSYTASWAIPSEGYEYVSGGCENGDDVEVSEDGKSIIVNATSKTSCTFYYDLEGSLSTSSDIVINFYNSSNNNSSLNYLSYEAIISKGFSVASSECTGDGDISFDSGNYEMTVTSSGPTVCSVYFVYSS